MKAAIYARYSTDKQREVSIDDQYRNCEKYANREGWNITYRYKDEAMSGTKADRPGYQQMLADAKAKAFEVLIVDDLSRLSRDDVETKTAIRRLVFWGLRVVGVADGFDTGNKGYKIQAGVRGLMNEIYLDDLREKTHRGLSGQALNGHNAGGRSYGYKHVPVEDASKRDQYGRPLVIAVRREVDAEQAKIVRSIFEWYADGFSPRRIANELNKRGVPSPRGSKWAASAIYGHPVKGTGILNNPLYSGRYVWNRSEWVKHPDTGRRHRVERPESEWIVQEMPELRIVPEKLWQRVKARQREQYGKSAAVREALHQNARVSGGPKYLLSGLLKCDVCGGNYAMANKFSYGCATRLNRGGCTNAILLPKRVAEAKLLEAVRDELLSDEAVAFYQSELRRIAAERREANDEKADERRLVEVEGEIQNIVAAIKAGILTRTTKTELEKAEAERLRSRVDGGQGEVTTIDPGRVELYRNMVRELGNATARQTARARTQLKALLGEVKLIPTEKGLDAEIAVTGYRTLLKSTGTDGAILTGSGGRI